MNSFSDFIPLLPEIVLASGACLILVVDLFLSDAQRRTTFLLSLACLLVTFFCVVYVKADTASRIFDGAFILDPMAVLLKAAVLLIVFAVFTYSEAYLKDRDIYRGEYFVLGLFATLGMLILISAHNLLTIYLGLELLSLCLYAMVAFHRDSASASEAAMKYFVLGALASGMLLYGMSMIYGVTGSLDINLISEQIFRSRGDLGATLGLVFIVVALAFKLGAMPFHMWLPDVYHGAPTSVTLFIATAPKIAGFALVMRLLVEGLGAMHEDWQGMLQILVVLSLAIGNVVAIAQTNIKRMFAYSTIAHVGFLLLGVIAGTQQGYSASMFYVIVYAITTLGAFGIIILLSRRGFEADNLEDLKGLNQRSPWFAFVMLLVLFSMAGVPPTVGFYAKLSVIRAVIDFDTDLVWLAIVAVAFSVIGAFYYLRAVRMIYFDQPTDSTELANNIGMRVLLSTNGLAILALGLYPAALMAICAEVLRW